MSAPKKILVPFCKSCNAVSLDVSRKRCWKCGNKTVLTKMEPNFQIVDIQVPKGY